MPVVDWSSSAEQLCPAHYTSIEVRWCHNGCQDSNNSTNNTLCPKAQGWVGFQLQGGGRYSPGSPPPPKEGSIDAPPPEGTLGYVTCALAANSTKRRKKMGSSVASKTIGTFLS